MFFQRTNIGKKPLCLTALFIFIFLATAEARMISVAGEKVNLRAGPGTKYSVLWEYGKGYPVRILETRGSWYKVVDFENDSGWVYRKLMARRPHMIVKKKRINIRSGPGSKYKLIGKANYGVVFKTLEQQKGWARIQHENGISGWVRRDLVWGW